MLLEAITLKKLVISSDCPTGPKEILQNGKGGILFKTGNYFDLYKKIINLKQKNISNNKKVLFAYNSLKKFDLNFNLKKYLKLYQTLNKIN